MCRFPPVLSGRSAFAVDPRITFWVCNRFCWTARAAAFLGMDAWVLLAGLVHCVERSDALGACVQLHCMLYYLMHRDFESFDGHAFDPDWYNDPVHRRYRRGGLLGSLFFLAVWRTLTVACFPDSAASYSVLRAWCAACWAGFAVRWLLHASVDHFPPSGVRNRRLLEELMGVQSVFKSWLVQSAAHCFVGKCYHDFDYCGCDPFRYTNYHRTLRMYAAFAAARQEAAPRRQADAAAASAAAAVYAEEEGGGGGMPSMHGHLEEFLVTVWLVYNLILADVLRWTVGINFFCRGGMTPHRHPTWAYSHIEKWLMQSRWDAWLKNRGAKRTTECVAECVAECDTECVICLESMRAAGALVSFPCNRNHVFHERCLRHWIQVRTAEYDYEYDLRRIEQSIRCPQCIGLLAALHKRRAAAAKKMQKRHAFARQQRAAAERR